MMVVVSPLVAAQGEHPSAQHSGTLFQRYGRQFSQASNRWSVVSCGRSCSIDLTHS
jgi:hypothetical protein